MLIIGCDFHSRFQQVAMVDTETGELVERRLDIRKIQFDGHFLGVCCAPDDGGGQGHEMVASCSGSQHCYSCRFLHSNLGA